MIKYTPKNHREAATIVDGKVVINEDELDIFSYYEDDIPDYLPSKKIKPWSEVSAMYCDIETTGLDPKVDSIKMIGAINEKGKNIIFDSSAESTIIKKFFRCLEIKSPDIIAFYNGMNFDIDFINYRCRLLGIKSPFWQSNKVTTFRTAQMFGKPQKYKAFWVNYGKTAVIDLMHQLYSYNYSAKNKLSRFRLKTATVDLGLTDREPIDLSYEEMKDCYKNWDHYGQEKMRKYLVSDLENTKLLGEFLLPPLWYQQTFVDWKFQSISTGGNGSKWNSILENEYPKHYVNRIRYDDKLKFSGGNTSAKAGYYKSGKIVKIDVSSLYPSIMLNYGIYSIKDKDRKTLSILKYLTETRLRMKKLAKSGDKEADMFQKSIKIFINSAFGFLGTVFLSFNDYVAASLVTAYGRAILKLIVKRVEECGGTSIQTDTDASIFMCEDGKEDEILEYVQDGLPKGINIEKEWVANAFYIPPGKSGKGLKKNYIIIDENDKINITGSCYVKRDKSWLETKFQPELVKIVYVEGKYSAIRYYDKLYTQICDRSIDLEKLKINRLIKSNEKTIPALGLGEPGKPSWYYMKDIYTKTGLRRQEPTQTDPYDIDYYLEILESKYNQVMMYVE